MKNYKLEKKLVGNDKWPRIGMIFVNGIQEEKILESKDDEKTIQSWKNIAVMRAKSIDPVKFYIGFCKKDDMAYLDHEFETNLTFAMRIGPEDINFFVVPKIWTDKVELELIDITIESDEKYKHIILI